MKPRIFSAARRSILSSSIVFTCVSSSAFAQSTWVGGTSTDWNTAVNWDNGLPGGNAFINSTPANIATISANLTVTPVDILVGSAGNGTLLHTAGTAGTGDVNWMFVGINGGTGTYNLGATSGGGTLTGLGLGSGSMNVGGTIATSGRLIVGSAGTGTVNINTTGTLKIGNDFTLGISGGTGVVRMDAGTINRNSGWTAIGADAGSNGTLSISGGSMTGTGDTYIGVNSGTGTMNLSGGSMTAGVNALIGYNNATGTLNVSGGTFTSSNWMAAGGDNGNGTINISGTGLLEQGTADVNSRLVLTNNNSTGTATVNLNGGTLRTNGMLDETPAAGASIFNFNGGILRPRAANATFMQGLTQSNVRNGGAVIDTNGFDITIGQALLHSNIGGDAATDGGLTKNGAGTLAMSGVNTFTGGVVVNGGILNITNGNTPAAGGLMGASSVTVNNGATLRSAGSNSFYGWDHTGYNSDITVNAGGSLTMAPGSDVGVRRVNLNGGTLAVEGTANTNWGSWRFTVAGAGLSATANSTASATDLVFQNGADINVSTAVTLAITGTINTPSNGGTSTVIKNGAGTLALSGANAFTGNISINNGTIAAGSFTQGNAAASISSNLGDLGTAVSRSITINNGGILSLTNGNVLGTGGSTGTLSGVTLVVNQGGVFQSGLNGAGAGWWNKIGAVNLNGGTIRIGSGANTTNFQALSLIGTVTVGGTTASTIDNHGSSNNASNAIHLGQNATGGQMITFNVADVTGDSVSDLNVSAKLLNTSATLTASGLTKTGLGTMTLSGANSYTGATTINGGRLVYQNTYASASHVIASGATLEFNVASGGLDGATTTFSGGGTFVKSGLGYLYWSQSAATFALGAGSLIDVQAGTLVIGSYANEDMNNSLADLNVAGGATFDSGACNAFVNALTGSGTINLAYDNNNPRTMTIGVNNGGGTFSGAITDGGIGGNGIVVKTGSGTQTLSGVNTYSGNTTVSGGTLALTNANANNQASTVTIAASGAKLQLSFAATDTVAGLFIGATEQGIGEYGHTNSGATNGGAGVGAMDAYFAAGTGRLNVTSGPPAAGFSAWQAANGTSQTIDLDHDSDGVSNGVEYFLGGTTNTTGFTALPGVIDSVGVLSVTWTKAATYTGTYGTDFVVQTSATLAAGSWVNETATVTFPTANEVKYTFPTGTTNFARLKVTGP